MSTSGKPASPAAKSVPAKKAPSAPKPPARRRRVNASGFRPSESEALVQYLRHPTSRGYWRLTANRRTDGRYLRYIFDHNGLDITAYRLDPSSSPQKTPQQTDDSDKVAAATKASTFFSAINAAYLVKTGNDLPELLKTDDHGIRSTDTFDAAGVLAKFPELVTIFEEKITHPNFASLVVKGGCFEIASGTVLLLSGWHGQNITFVALEKEPLAALSEILASAELISGPTIERVFSPEEELLAPYFELLKIGYDTTIRDERLRPQLESAFEYFEKDDFTHTISTLGLIAEDYLTQIYENYFRAPCPKGNTLGQIYDQLHQKIREALAPKPPELTPLEPLYKSLAELQKPPEEGKKVSASAIVSAVRDAINIIKSDRRYFLEKIESSTKAPKRLSIFPDLLHDNLMELIRNRNAASHKTRIPLGRFEALRTLYCLCAFALWWREEKTRTDWALDALEILRAAVAK